MLTLVIEPLKLWDERKEEFITAIEKKQIITLEHSLVSISKWEQKWHKAFLTKTPKTNDETIDYIKCMTITQNVNPNIYLYLSDKNKKMIMEYISDPMTATKINNIEKKSNNEIMTSELIYYYMLELKIPVEFQKWHLNRLLTLIELCSVKNKPPKKMSNKEIVSGYAEINAQRRKQLNSKG